MNGAIDTLLQLYDGSVWDGNLVSKKDRNELVRAGWAYRFGEGMNAITLQGVEAVLLLDLQKLRKGT